MNIRKSFLAALLLSSGLALSTIASAQAAAAGQGTEYSEKGADTCLVCHTEAWPYPIFPIFKTKHANRADKRTPFAGLQCEACHGPGAKHAGSGDKTAISSLKSNSPVPPAERNKVCLGCHSGNARTGWIASTHESNNLACTDCHRIHAERDPVLAKSTQVDVCYKCHKKQRADFHKPSAHPVRSGQMTCNECHSPHGSSAVAMLVKPTVNQTCYTCHAEKRGPFLWEHAPVAENCTLCHSPHGSARPSLLTKTPPLLCQQCHTVAGHPSVARTGAALPGAGGVGAGFVLAGSCTNCHSQVHGSNHPSGVKLMR
ncbi:MAG: DmsE family decaheme c-type cytochrome [Gammaproteobacteria bacterium]|nr:DmsE family decaheme c-type cytochrome [Gammaproteobacteria bacterium]MDH5533983.1 DmsE family decaheme c-type cytochrome [Betaproteobacteria bacterium]